jgi:hypothetical protein
MLTKQCAADWHGRRVQALEPHGAPAPFPAWRDPSDLPIVVLLAEVTTARLDKITDLFNRGKMNKPSECVLRHMPTAPVCR